jgi:hypothetical protein
MNTKQKALTLITLSSLPTFSFAQTQLTYGRPIAEGLASIQYFIQLLNVILPSLAVIIFFWLVVKFIWDKSKGEKGDPKSLLWGIVALAVLFGVYGLVRLMASFVGVNTDGNTRITAPALPTQAR